MNSRTHYAAILDILQCVSNKRLHGRCNQLHNFKVLVVQDCCFLLVKLIKTVTDASEVKALNTVFNRFLSCTLKVQKLREESLMPVGNTYASEPSVKWDIDAELVLQYFDILHVHPRLQNVANIVYKSLEFFL